LILLDVVEYKAINLVDYVTLLALGGWHISETQVIRGLRIISVHLVFGQVRCLEVEAFSSCFDFFLRGFEFG
jgi:hypothetical protein